jgi:tetratricopeptide (TPR) repeat protein
MFEITLFKIKSEDDRIKTAEKQIDKLTDVLRKTSDDDVKINLLHHIGKIYAKINNSQKALEYFNQVITINPKADYCILQITRIYDQRKDYVASKSNLALIFEDESILKNISVSLLLAFYDILSVSKYEDIRVKYIDAQINDFVINIVQSLDSNFDQPYQTINKFSDMLSYRYLEEFEFIVDNLPEPSNIDANNELRYNYANILSIYYKHLKDKYNKSDKEEKMNSIKKSVVEYFESVSLTDFQKRNVGKFWLNTENYQEALNVVKDLDYSDGEFNNQTLCKIYKGLKDFDNAKVAIDTAINLGTKKKTPAKFMAAFYHDKSEVEFYQTLPNCLISLETAIKTSVDDNLKKQWQAKLVNWQAQFN